MIKLAIVFIVLGYVASGCGAPFQGERGAPGASIVGPQGPAGADGKPGTNGSNGAAGAVGGGCSVTTLASGATPAPYGGALIQCADGSSSIVLNGTPGAAGTVVTPVKFCPGATTYPSTFVEIGWCVNQTLYAVYSANNGFFTEIPSGAYSSNAIGSSCSFTVQPNCVIVN